MKLTETSRPTPCQKYFGSGVQEPAQTVPQVCDGFKYVSALSETQETAESGAKNPSVGGTQ